MDDEKYGGRHDRDRRPPLSIEEIIAHDNVPAAVPLPAATAARLSTRLITLSGVEMADVQSMLHAHEARPDGVRLSLPPSAFLGQPVRAGHRVAPEFLMLPGGAETIGEAFKPDWAPLVYHPKLSARRRPRLLRGADGRKVIPLDNQSFIYGSDDRAVFYPSGYPWHCIGKVDVFPSATAKSPTTWGSGVLIGDRVVLTAGHVPPVNPPSGQWKMRFTAGLYNGSPVDGPGAVSYVSDFNGYLGGVSGTDYAVLRLYEPLVPTWGISAGRTMTAPGMAASIGGLPAIHSISPPTRARRTKTGSPCSTLLPTKAGWNSSTTATPRAATPGGPSGASGPTGSRTWSGRSAAISRVRTTTSAPAGIHFRTC